MMKHKKNFHFFVQIIGWAEDQNKKEKKDRKINLKKGCVFYKPKMKKSLKNQSKRMHEKVFVSTLLRDTQIIQRINRGNRIRTSTFGPPAWAHPDSPQYIHQNSVQLEIRLVVLCCKVSFPSQRMQNV